MFGRSVESIPQREASGGLALCHIQLSSNFPARVCENAAAKVRQCRIFGCWILTEGHIYK